MTAPMMNLPTRAPFLRFAWTRHFLPPTGALHSTKESIIEWTQLSENLPPPLLRTAKEG